MADELVYIGNDNPAIIYVSQTVLGVTTTLDLSAVTRMTLELEGHDTVLDTDDDATLIDWSAGSGAIEFNLSGAALDISVGRYRATLIAFDPDHTNGQVLFHIDRDDLRFNFI